MFVNWAEGGTSCRTGQDPAENDCAYLCKILVKNFADRDSRSALYWSMGQSPGPKMDEPREILEDSPSKETAIQTNRK